MTCNLIQASLNFSLCLTSGSTLNPCRPVKPLISFEETSASGNGRRRDDPPTPPYLGDLFCLIFPSFSHENVTSKEEGETTFRRSLWSPHLLCTNEVGWGKYFSTLLPFTSYIFRQKNILFPSAGDSPSNMGRHLFAGVDDVEGGLRGSGGTRRL